MKIWPPGPPSHRRLLCCRALCWLSPLSWKELKIPLLPNGEYTYAPLPTLHLLHEMTAADIASVFSRAFNTFHTWLILIWHVVE